MENFFDKRLKIIIIATFGILAIFLLIQSVGAVIDISMKKKMAEKVSNFKSHNITFRGTADVDVIPDMAAFTVTVREEGVTAIEAQQKMVEKSNKAMELFKKSGIDKVDIQTKNYNTFPKYSFEPCSKEPCEPTKSTISGYSASQSISIKLRDTAKAGEITTAIAQLEISDVRGPSFGVEDSSKFKLQAQGEAIKKVKEEALVTAKNLGVTLGEVVSFSEDPQYPSFSPMMAKMSGDARGAISPDLEAGKQKISSTVSITYEIKE
jgi:uncharacterized protein YggE